MKPVRHFCYMFSLAFLDLTVPTYNSILIVLNLLTNGNIALIYSVTVNKKQSIVHG